MKTTIIKKNDLKEKKWYMIDAEGKRLGRVASESAKILLGKKNPKICDNLDCGDFLVIINSKKLDFHRKKLEDNVYSWHTTYPGGFRQVPLKVMMKKKPNWVIRKAVQRMLPKNVLGRKIIKKLFIYEDENYLQKAQKPELVKL